MANNRIRNIGPVGMEWLRGIGIHSLEDLALVGSVQAYLQLKAARPGVSILALYAMEAALWNLHWNALPPELKDSLHEQVGYSPKKNKKIRLESPD
ncbi:TfoX/Sxy family DNA transformation protein [Paenibacillus chartarius]|uniref:TfoX/Sxy family DNA transformation protein n=1 Tax=Paenibacillus chartarius TaxID=747481 RepID=A0ABV6DLS6_9BACL